MCLIDKEFFKKSFESTIEPLLMLYKGGGNSEVIS